MEPLKTALNPLEATAIILEALTWAQGQIKFKIMISCSNDMKKTNFTKLWPKRSESILFLLLWL